MEDQVTRQDNAEVSGLKIGVLGGTGPQGRGLAMRWARAGFTVVLGSRVADRAAATAAELCDLAGVQTVTGLDNAACAAAVDVVVVAVPWHGHRELLEFLRHELVGKIVVDCVNPLGFDESGPFALRVEDGSAAQQAAALLPESRVTSAFHHVSAHRLADLSVSDMDVDVLVLGEDRAAIDTVRALVDAIAGMRGVYGGRLRDAHQVEAFTANLITVNRHHRALPGIRVIDAS
ncbi:MAG TPA: NADPH-dependent F420 reductase [Actinokineospora sp.]|nr:NADPH-dependent F420 reductase [Actinokineospora sp.]